MKTSLVVSAVTGVGLFTLDTTLFGWWMIVFSPLIFFFMAALAGALD